MRDWALIGFATSGLAGLAPWGIGVHLPSAYAMTCAVVGAVSGALVGGAMHGLLGWCRPQLRVAVAMLLAITLLGAWGAFVATFSAWLIVPDLASMGVPMGWMAAVAQTGWLAPTYATAAKADWPRWPLVLACSLAAPACGVFGAVAVFWFADVVNFIALCPPCNK
jgi:hypothetical protein